MTTAGRGKLGRAKKSKAVNPSEGYRTYRS